MRKPMGNLSTLIPHPYDVPKHEHENKRTRRAVTKAARRFAFQWDIWLSLEMLAAGWHTRAGNLFELFVGHGEVDDIS